MRETLTCIRCPVPARVARTGRRPATCGQRSMWDVLAWLYPETQRHNMLQMAPVPQGRTRAEVLACVGELFSRHESLRTRYQVAGDGELWQYLAPDETLDVELFSVTAGQVNELYRLVQHELTETRFDLTCQLPLRVVVAEVDGVPLAVAFTVSHIAADLTGARVMRAELSGLLEAPDGASLPPPRWQPFEQAEFEASPAGREALSRSMRRWQAAIEVLPRTQLAMDRIPPAEPARFWSGDLRSRALPAALAVLARRYRTSTAAVALAATAVVLGHRAGVERCALGLIASNRVDPRLEHAVGNITQIVWTDVDLSGPTFTQVVRSAGAGALSAYQRGLHDTRRLEELVAEVGHRRGVAIDVSTFYNDTRVRAGLEAAGEDSPEEIAAARADSSFAWSSWLERERMTGYLVLADDEEPGWARLSIMTDTTLHPPEIARRLVEGVEAVLVAALRESTLTELRAATGLTPPERGAGWVLIEGCWTHLPAVEQLVRDAVQPADVRVVAEWHDGDRVEIAAHVVAPQRARTPQEVHDACMALLDDRRTATAPHRYVLYAAGTDVDVAIGGAPALAAGPGR
ncbi:condensation domain-containing protein [Dactylosporangium sp. NPDC048998]|uniref:condensation domain-containing protein n=1 Tax=Dactylosporangium sp. NPDC048998 TaxID=3363976 RepID=UPI00371A2FE8